MFPTPRREANISNFDVLNASIYMLENGCKWRCLPKEYGNWDIIYLRLRRWSKKGALQKAFLLLQEKNIIQFSVEIISLDSTGIFMQTLLLLIASAFAVLNLLVDIVDALIDPRIRLQ